MLKEIVGVLNLEIQKTKKKGGAGSADNQEESKATQQKFTLKHSLRFPL